MCGAYSKLQITNFVDTPVDGLPLRAGSWSLRALRLKRLRASRTYI